MSELVKGSKYTAEQKANVAIQYSIHGNMKKAARQSGVPRTTIIHWQKQSWWNELISEIRSAKADEHRAKYSELVDKAQEVALEKLPEASAQQAMIIAATGTDKIRLHDGMPTAITGKVGSIDDLAKAFNKLANQHVVSVQMPDDTDDADQE